MKITVYAKKRMKKDGKPFSVYLSKITNREGDEIPVTLHFKQTVSVIPPEKCPCVIEFPKTSANLSKKEKRYAKTDVVTGEQVETISIDNQLWISEYRICENEYRDTSLDDFED